MPICRPSVNVMDSIASLKLWIESTVFITWSCTEYWRYLQLLKGKKKTFWYLRLTKAKTSIVLSWYLRVLLCDPLRKSNRQLILPFSIWVTVLTWQRYIWLSYSKIISAWEPWGIIVTVSVSLAITEQVRYSPLLPILSVALVMKIHVSC